ncbi:hypothetical protein [Halarcobacter sp.]|uniref:hypothetical protein n=1 Tax=Halarcobacter sp. TaxID=2321133 RepID=UPI003AFFABCB
MNEKKYTVNEVVYDEFYRVKLPFLYYLFTKNAITIILLMYFIIIHLFNYSINAYLASTFLTLMFGYRQFFKAYRGDEFNIWLISIWGDLVLSIKKRNKND